jgi:hypothetical protein
VTDKTAKEERIYALAVAENLDPVRAVHAHRRVEAIPDDATRAAVRRQLTGVVLPADDIRSQFTVIETRGDGEQIEATQKRVEVMVEDYCLRHPPALVAHMLFGADEFLRSIVAKAMAVHDNFFCEGGEGITHSVNGVIGPDMLVAISTSRPGVRWVIDNGFLLGNLLNLVQYDKWCDIDSCGNGYCIGNYPSSTVPFANGNTLILAHFCSLCWSRFVKDNKIKPKKFEILQPDGFGSL